MQQSPSNSMLPAGTRVVSHSELQAYWMPFTANRQFKADPRMMASAKDMHYTTADGRQVLDGTAGLWCVNAGHSRPRIVEAIQKQAATLDYSPAFQMGHPGAFTLAERMVNMAPPGFGHVFFCNSGSESVDTALKIALAYHHARGEAGRTRFIGREKGYHGVGFGGIAVGGLVNNRFRFGPLLPGVDHLPSTHNMQHNAFTRGQPAWGAHLADHLNDLVALHGAGSIAAVIVEPVMGSAGVLIPPKGYLERLRALCDQHGLLLIFDEVITGFGRVGAPLATHHFGVVPDMITVAKGITNGAVPMGAVLVKKSIYDTFMQGPDNAIELFHGYTYSAHPLATAAAHATLDTYAEENLFERAREMSGYFENAVHSLKDLPHVTDLRNIGLMGAIDLASRPNQPGARAFDVYQRCFNRGVLIRTTGDTIALSPPLIVGKEHIDTLFGMLAEEIRAVK